MRHFLHQREVAVVMQRVDEEDERGAFDNDIDDDDDDSIEDEQGVRAMQQLLEREEREEREAEAHSQNKHKRHRKLAWDLNAQRESDGRTAIHGAALASSARTSGAGEHELAAESLIFHRASVDLRDMHGATPLHVASQQVCVCVCVCVRGVRGVRCVHALCVRCVHALCGRACVRACLLCGGVASSSCVFVDSAWVGHVD